VKKNCVEKEHGHGTKENHRLCGVKNIDVRSENANNSRLHAPRVQHPMFFFSFMNYASICKIQVTMSHPFEQAKKFNGHVK